MKSDLFDQTLTSLKGHAGDRRRRDRTFARRSTICLVSVGLPAFLAALLLSITGPWWAEWLSLLIAHAALAPFIVAHVRILSRSCRWEDANLAVSLTFRDDLRDVGPLMEALECTDNIARPLIIKALARLLPRLQADDAEQLDDEQRACLYSALQAASDPTSYHYNVELAVIMLRAVGQIGDRRALNLVRRLAQAEARRAPDERIRLAAEECLPLLEARTDPTRPRQTLLRPADASATAVPAILLRPAAGASTTPPERLLRPHPSDSGPLA